MASNVSRPSPGKTGWFNAQLFGALMLFLAVIIFFAYRSSLNGEFVYDDYTSVLENYYITNPHYLLKIPFSSFPPHSNEQGLYRPVLAVSYMIDYFVWGWRPLGFHITNLLLYFLTCGLFYVFVLRLTKNTYVASFSVLLFALLPAHVENVAWISGRAGILSGMFFIGSLVLYDFALAHERAHRGLILAALISYVLAVSSYESALVLPLFIFFIDLYRLKGKKLGEIIQVRFYPIYLPLILITAGFLLIRFMVLGALGPVGEHQVLYGTALPERLMLVPKIIVKNLFIVVFPFRLTALYEPSIEPHFYPLGFVFSSLVLVALLFLACVLFRRRPFIALGIVLFLIGILPRSNIVPVGGIVSERALLLPSVGFCLALGALLGGYVKREGFFLDNTRNVVLMAFFLTISLLFLLRTSSRAADWRTAIGFWHSEVKMHPNSSVAHNSLGHSYYRQREFDKAETEFRKAIELDPSHYTAYHNLAKMLMEQKRAAAAEKVLDSAYAQGSDSQGGNFAVIGGLYFDLGKPVRAKESFEKALELNPENHIALQELGNFAVQGGKYEDALKLYSRALEATSSDLFRALILNNRSIAYEKLGKGQESIRDAELANKLDPTLPGPYLKLASFYAGNNQTDRAIALLERAIQRANPKDFELYYFLGRLYLGLGLSEKAFNTVKSYQLVNPFEPRMYFFLAEVYIQNKQYDKALLAYQQVLKFAPRDSQTHALIGDLLARAGKRDKAIEFLKKALEYDPKNQFAQERLKAAEQSASQQSHTPKTAPASKN
jgi:tetratricopeptide (TPR) repeat protein